MINAVATKFLKDFKAKLESYGIVVDLKHSNDLSLISEYTKSFRLRNIIKDRELMTEGDLALLRDTPNFTIGLYNRSPIRQIEDYGKNIPLQGMLYSSGVTSNAVDTDVLLSSMTEFVPSDIEIRRVLPASFDLKVKMMASNSTALEIIEFLYVSEYVGKQITTNFEIDFGPEYEPLEFDYNVSCAEIDEYGVIDYTAYGDLQQVSFSVTVKGLFLSMFKRIDKSISEYTFVQDFN